MKIKLRKLKEIKLGLIVSGSILCIFGLIMIWRTLNFTPSKTTPFVEIEKSYIAPNTWLVNAVEFDSIKGWNIISELRWENQNIFQGADDNKIIHADLFDEKHQYLPLVYTVYYIGMTIFIFLIFLYLFKFVNQLQDGKIFGDNNIIYLYLSGRWLLVLSQFYFFYNMTISLILPFWDIHAIFPFTQFDHFLLFSIMATTGLLIQLFTRSIIKGQEIQIEQELTV